MSSFISNATTFIEISPTEKVEVKKGLAYGEYAKLAEHMNAPKGEMALSAIVAILQQVIVSWTVHDENNVVVPYKPELIEKLSIEAMTVLTEKVVALYSPEKKSDKQ